MTADPLWSELNTLKELTEKMIVVLEKKRDLAMALKDVEAQEKSIELRKNMVMESIRIHKLLVNNNERTFK